MKPQFFFDHFYRCLAPEHFQAAKDLLSFFKKSGQHKTKKTPDGFEWEALYFNSRCGVDFQLTVAADGNVHGWAPNMMGLAYSHFEEKPAASYLAGSFPDLNWSPVNIKKEDGSPWFTGLMTRVLPHYFIWNMDYDPRELESRLTRGNADYELASLDSFECFVPSSLWEPFGNAMKWCIDTRTSLGKWEPDAGRHEFCFAKKGGGIFRLSTYRIDEESSLVSAFRLKGQATGGMPVRERLGKFELKSEDGKAFSLTFQWPT